MLGWSSAPTASASRWNKRISRSVARAPALMVLSATIRLSLHLAGFEDGSHASLGQQLQRARNLPGWPRAEWSRGCRLRRCGSPVPRRSCSANQQDGLHHRRRPPSDMSGSRSDRRARASAAVVASVRLAAASRARARIGDRRHAFGRPPPLRHPLAVAHARAPFRPSRHPATPARQGSRPCIRRASVPRRIAAAALCPP